MSKYDIRRYTKERNSRQGREVYDDHLMKWVLLSSILGDQTSYSESTSCNGSYSSSSSSSDSGGGFSGFGGGDFGGGGASGDW